MFEDEVKVQRVKGLRLANDTTPHDVVHFISPEGGNRYVRLADVVDVR